MKRVAFLFLMCPLFTSCIWIGGDGVKRRGEKPSYVANTTENDRENKTHDKVMPPSEGGGERDFIGRVYDFAGKARLSHPGVKNVEDFRRMMADPNQARKFYNKVSERYDIGSYEMFSETLSRYYDSLAMEEAKRQQTVMDAARQGYEWETTENDGGENTAEKWGDMMVNLYYYSANELGMTGLGTLQDFWNGMKDERVRRNYFDVVSSRYNVGDYETFNRNLSRYYDSLAKSEDVRRKEVGEERNAAEDETEEGEYSNEEYGFSWRLYEIDGNQWKIDTDLDTTEDEKGGRQVFSASNPSPDPDGLIILVGAWPNNLNGSTDAWYLYDWMEMQGNTVFCEHMKKTFFCGRNALKYNRTEQIYGTQVRQFSYVYLTKKHMILVSVGMSERTFERLVNEGSGYSPEALVRVVLAGYSIDDKN